MKVVFLQPVINLAHPDISDTCNPIKTSPLYATDQDSGGAIEHPQEMSTTVEIGKRPRLPEHGTTLAL
jgi:hypothetical protein